MDTPTSSEWNAIDALITEAEGPLDRLRATKDCADLVALADVHLRLRRMVDRCGEGAASMRSAA